MNFVGKMLLIFTMMFSLIFVGLASVVFLTAKNYKAEVDKLSAEVKKAKEATNATEQQVAAAIAATKAADQKRVEAEKDLNGQIETLNDGRNQLESQRKDFDTQRAVMQQSMEVAQSERELRIQETNVLRDALKKTQVDANKLQMDMTERNAIIAEQSKKIAVLDRQGRELRNKLRGAMGYLQKLGYSVSEQELLGISAPPDVPGIITQVDPSNKKAQISLGSDDGILPGHVLQIYRKNPPEFLGELKITIVEPDSAVGEVVGGKTNLGKRMQEGDNVSSTIPRGE